MSLVGTRPPTVDEWDKYELHHRARLATKPGLTGMWQVSGRSNITDLQRVVPEMLFDVEEFSIIHGHIPCFYAEGDHWSFAKLDADGNVIEVREKKRISENCTLGAYYFASAKLFADLYNEYYG